MTELEKLKMLLGVTDASKDGVFSFALETVHEMVKNYCGIEEIPEGLTNTVVRMAADLSRSEGYGSEAAPQTAKSVTRGDVTIAYGGTGAAAGLTGEKAVLDDYRTQLNAYRRLRW